VPGLEAAHVDVAVVGVAREAVAPRLQRLVHLVKQHVGQQRAQRPALRRAQMTLHHYPTIHDAGVQVGTDQPEDSSIIDAPAQPVDQDVVVDPVEELRQVHVHHHALARLHVRTGGLDRVVRPPAGPKPVAVFAEGGVDQRLQHLQQACWISRSVTVGMPSSRWLPSGLGIITLRTGLGR
jgi:hypothetical protein